MKKTFLGSLTAALVMICGLSASSSSPPASPVPYPPWGEKGNPAREKGVVFTVPEVTNIADLHGEPMEAELVLYVGGNYFFAMGPLVEIFESKYPNIKGKIFYETLPPGILVQQLRSGGTITVGNLTLTVRPDVFQGGQERVDELIEKGELEGPAVPFLKNKLAIMVPEGNPAKIASLKELGRPGLRLANPNPETEGIAGNIRKALVKAGGEKLATRVYKEKVAGGEALITEIHHRQTPLWILQKKVDAGVVWTSEIEFQKMAGHPLTGVDIPGEQNQEGKQAAAMVKDAPHPKHARSWIRFLQSPEARAVFEKYGIEPISRE